MPQFAAQIGREVTGNRPFDDEVGDLAFLDAGAGGHRAEHGAGPLTCRSAHDGDDVGRLVEAGAGGPPTRTLPGSVLGRPSRV
ncbi:hypothetical protein AB0D27_00245 [Streptomyces sp. NPDC048415]|uniref:hypothetical protein n=1 Tax=Streptomyces sp. NPDC048415 TaxID=3154822 RepID=UPI003426AD44